jgi:2C-methyl-D-erythritol 2,4-cyclodiphosphate synthase
MFYTVVYVAIVVIANAKNIDTHQLTIREFIIIIINITKRKLR